MPNTNNTFPTEICKLLLYIQNVISVCWLGLSHLLPCPALCFDHLASWLQVSYPHHMSCTYTIDEANVSAVMQAVKLLLIDGILTAL